MHQQAGGGAADLQADQDRQGGRGKGEQCSNRQGTATRSREGSRAGGSQGWEGGRVSDKEAELESRSFQIACKDAQPTWPQVQNTPNMAHSTALSTSASSNTISAAGSRAKGVYEGVCGGKKRW